MRLKLSEELKFREFLLNIKTQFVCWRKCESRRSSLWWNLMEHDRFLFRWYLHIFNLLLIKCINQTPHPGIAQFHISEEKFRDRCLIFLWSHHIRICVSVARLKVSVFISLVGLFAWFFFHQKSASSICDGIFSGIIVTIQFKHFVHMCACKRALDYCRCQMQTKGKQIEFANWKLKNFVDSSEKVAPKKENDITKYGNNFGPFSDSFNTTSKKNRTCLNSKQRENKRRRLCCANA